MRLQSKNIDFQESKSSKRLRYILAVLYFVQVILTTFPFMLGGAEDGNLHQLTAFQIAFQADGYNTVEEVKLALIFGIFIVFPIVCFFFFVLDKKTNIKNLVSVACAVVCSCLITFGIGTAIAFGAVLTLLLYVLILFLSTMSIMSFVIDSKNNG